MICIITDKCRRHIESLFPLTAILCSPRPIVLLNGSIRLSFAPLKFLPGIINFPCSMLF